MHQAAGSGRGATVAWRIGFWIAMVEELVLVFTILTSFLFLERVPREGPTNPELAASVKWAYIYEEGGVLMGCLALAGAIGVVGGWMVLRERRLSRHFVAAYLAVLLLCLGIHVWAFTTLLNAPTLSFIVTGVIDSGYQLSPTSWAVNDVLQVIIWGLAGICYVTALLLETKGQRRATKPAEAMGDVGV